MPVSDRREPGVYVTIEDASYVQGPTLVGRTVYTVGCCPKGPHNRVVEVTSQPEFQKRFGQPDYHKTTQTHYCMDAAMQFTGRGLYVRVMPEDSTLANVLISESSTPTSTEGTVDEFTFTEDSDEVTVDATVYDQFEIGDWIFAGDGLDESKDARQIISKDDTANTYKLNANYTGSTTGWGTKSTTASKYMPYVSTSNVVPQDANYEEAADVDPEVVYMFYATGAGQYYNNLKLKGTRNVELEKMYTDKEGNVKFPYLFMNVGVYDTNEYGDDRLLEGPWVVSLTAKNPDGMVIRDLSTGLPLFIQTIVNQRSELIRMVAGSAIDQLSLPPNVGNNQIVSNNNRAQIMLMLSAGSPVATTMYASNDNALHFANGDDGTSDGSPLYSNSGNLNVGEEIYGLAKQAFNASMTSVDGSIEQLREVTYPWYTMDYILTGGWPAKVQAGGRDLAAYRQDVFHIGDSGFNRSKEDDQDARLNDVGWNDWTSMLYTQYRKRFDEYTGDEFYITPVYHAIRRHLQVDASYFIAEPVAGIEKGAITEPIKLAYLANHTERGDLIDVELNPTIVEPDGKYFLQQFTTWKRLSILKRAHAAKFVCYVRKMLPPLLKGILERKATNYWINQAQFRAQHFMNQFVGGPTESFNVLEYANVSIDFDDTASELNVYIDMKPHRVIERINVYLIVH